MAVYLCLTFPMARYLDIKAVEGFYDRFGRKLDSQAFYEDPALERLVAAAEFSQAKNVMEFGCGTGRFAHRLLSQELSPQARLAACDLSKTMVDLATEKLAAFPQRATVWQSAAQVDFSPGTPPFQRIVSAFVLDLMPPPAIRAFVAEAHRTLAPGGLLCLANLTRGKGVASILTSTIWTGLATLSPALVGGCRPINVTNWLEPHQWRIRHHSVTSAWSVPLEVTVAERI